MTQHMKAAIATQPGDVDVLQIQDVERPQPTEDEIRIQVRAFGLNKAEAYNRQGKHGGFSGKWALGIEAAGVVDHDPSGGLPSGQKVITAMGGMMFDRHGSYAEYICVKRSNVIAIDSAIEFVALATLPEAYLTAWGALDHDGSLQSGQTVLVRGGTTAVGMAAITYAKAKGARVITTTRQESRVQKLRGLGADEVLIEDGNIHERVQGLTKGGADKAIELIGGATVLDTMHSMRKWGDVAFVGFVGAPPVLEKLHLMNDLPNTVRLSFFGSGLLGKEDLPLSDAPMEWIADQVASGQMPSILSRTFDFDDIRDAQKLLESNEAFGKIVVAHPS